MAAEPGNADDVAAAIPEPDTLERRVFEARLEARLLGGDPELPRVDRFVLERMLGAGGMGTVWLARDEALGRRVALKLVRRGRDAAGERMRVREARGLASITHPNVVAVFDVGEHDGRVWLAMEHVPGRTLRQCAAELDHGAALAHWLAAGRGLAEIHRAGLVHRDVKPDNVLLGDDGRVRVIDLGLVRQTAELTAKPAPVDPRAGAVVMTPGFVGTRTYAAPEQQRGDPVDARADQYAFCVALLESLRAARAPPGRDLPPALLAVIARGRDPDPARRFPDMPALLAALAHAARPPRRTLRAALILLALLALALVTYFATTTTTTTPDPARAACLARARPVCDGAASESLELALTCIDPACTDLDLAPPAALLTGERLPFDIDVDNRTPRSVTLRWHAADVARSGAAELPPGRRPLPPHFDRPDLPLCLDLVDARGHLRSVLVERAAACP